MFALVLFTDNIYFICETSDIQLYKRKPPSVRYSDNKRYTARVLSLSVDRRLLENVKTCMESKHGNKYVKDLVATKTEVSSTDLFMNIKKGIIDDRKLYIDKYIKISNELQSNNCNFKIKASKQKHNKFFEDETTFVEMKIVPSDQLVDKENCESKENLENAVKQKPPPKKSRLPPTEIPKPKKTRKASLSNEFGDIDTCVLKDNTHTNLDTKHGKSKQNLKDRRASQSVEENKPLIRECTVQIENPKYDINEKQVRNEIENPKFDDNAKQNRDDIQTNSRVLSNEAEQTSNNFEIQKPESTITVQIEKPKYDINEKQVRNEIEIENPKLDDNAKQVHDDIQTNSRVLSNEGEQTSNNFEIQKPESTIYFYNTEGDFIEKASNCKKRNIDSDITYTNSTFNILPTIFENDNIKELTNSSVKDSVLQDLKGAGLKNNDCRDLNETMTLIANDSWNTLIITSHVSDSQCSLEPEVAGYEVVDGVIEPESSISTSTPAIVNRKNDLLDDIIKGKFFANTDLENENCFTEIHPKFCSTFLESSELPKTSAEETFPDECHQEDQEEYHPSTYNSEEESLEENAACGTLTNADAVSEALDINLRSIEGMSAPDDKDLKVSTSNIPAYKKQHFCYYCRKFQTKIARHLTLKHSEEKDVREFLDVPKGNQDRKRLIAAIRKRGDHLYNTDRTCNKGELIVCRRPNEERKKKANNFMPCVICKGQYSKSTLRHHFQKCAVANNIKLENKGEKIIMVKGRTVAGRIYEGASGIVRKHIIPYLREDEVVRVIRYDDLIIAFANKQCEKYRTHQHHYAMIRARLRLIGRLLIAVKEINPTIENFSSIYHPKHYDVVIQAVKRVANFNEEKCTFEHPAVASALGTLLKQVGEVLRSKHIKSENDEGQKRVENFLKLQSEDYGTTVNKLVIETQTQNYRRKKVVLPNTEDIKKLHDHLKNLRETHFKRLQKKFSIGDWRKLSEALLVSLQLFNRRRAGEIERIYLEDFEQRQGIDTNNVIFDELSAEGKAHAKKYVRFIIRGKLNRTVPVLLTTEMLDCLLLTIRYRTKAGVKSSNPYLFGINSDDSTRFKYLRACNLIRQYATECGAEMPDTLRGTELRKQIATKCIQLNLSENQVSDLANFLGHHKDIHKQIYRQPLIETDIVKISQLLEIAQGTRNDTATETESGQDFDNSDRFIAQQHRAQINTEKNTDEQDTDSASSDESYTDTKLTKKRGWSDEEKTVVFTVFKETINGGKMPTGKEMQNVINGNVCLRDRTVPQLRTWLYTQKKKYLE